MRSKEGADDYRYFPEPDLPPVEVSEDWIKEIEDEMPVMPVNGGSTTLTTLAYPTTTPWY